MSSVRRRRAARGVGGGCFPPPSFSLTSELEGEG